MPREAKNINHDRYFPHCLARQKLHVKFSAHRSYWLSYRHNRPLAQLRALVCAGRSLVALQDDRRSKCHRMAAYNNTKEIIMRSRNVQIVCNQIDKICLKACAQRFRYVLFAFIHTQTYFEYYTLTLRLASWVKKAVIYAYWTKELFDICREHVSHMATLPSVSRHVIHADNLRPRH